MAVSKAVQFVVLLALCYSLLNQQYRQSVTVFFEKFAGTKTSSLHGREKRDATTTTTPDETTTIAREEDLTIDMEFSEAFNDRNNQLYQDVYSAIQGTCGRAITGCLVDTLLFRFMLQSGSTIATYTLRAPTIEDLQVKEVSTGIFIELVSKYPMVFDSDTPLELDHQKIFVGESVTVTCGPPPEDLSFGSAWTAKWTLNGNPVRLDAQLSRSDGASKLTIPKFFQADDGLYECRLEREDGSVFRQRGTFTSEKTPLITVTPVKKIVKCWDENVELKCSVNSPYEVAFQGLDGGSDTGEDISYSFRVPAECPSSARTIICQVQLRETSKTFQEEIVLEFTTEEFVCFSEMFGDGPEGFLAKAPCDGKLVGEKTAVCKADGTYGDTQDNCGLQREPEQPELLELLEQSEVMQKMSATDTWVNPKCVFWNFSLFNGLGGWDQGCSLVFNETINCSCNHLTSFSILMSPFTPNDPVLDYITYIGVGISIVSLFICLIIQAVIWRKIRGNSTSYLRHVSIVNIAVSLLIANIWFIIGAAIAKADQKNPPACSAATFFIHFFYLALFFWMLASGLLLLYRMISVFDGGLSKMAMLAIGFSLGYGAPLIIATITIAVTAPSQQYTRGETVCWLNWDESKALLAFVIPALLIVLINLIILLVVIYKLLRRRVGTQLGEKHVLLVIARSLAVLTPLFGLTWGLGVGTMTNPKNRGIHIAFAFFNSLQGFFILVFGTLLDSKVRSSLKGILMWSDICLQRKPNEEFSSSGLGFFGYWRAGFAKGNMSSEDNEDNEDSDNDSIFNF